MHVIYRSVSGAEFAVIRSTKATFVLLQSDDMALNFKQSALLFAATTATYGAMCVVRKSLTKRHFAGKTVLITGGARGLGLELAREFCYYGARVAICSRNPAQLRRALKELVATGGQATAFRCDVTNKEQAARLVNAVEMEFGTVDVLVNNAGIIHVGPWNTMTERDYERSIATHFWAAYYLIEAVLPKMIERKSGNIINISSIGGRISVPHLIPYCVGKFALAGLSEGLQSELRRLGIIVTSVFPGIMRTGSPRNAMFKGQNRKEYAWFSLSSSIPGLSINSRRAAQQIVQAAALGRAELSVGLLCKIATRVHHVMPGVSNYLLQVMARILPAEGGIGQNQLRGADSQSIVSPSLFTVLNERAAIRNNER